jgi:hypothetical protein
VEAGEPDVRDHLVFDHPDDEGDLPGGGDLGLDLDVAEKSRRVEGLDVPAPLDRVVGAAFPEVEAREELGQPLAPEPDGPDFPNRLALPGFLGALLGERRRGGRGRQEGDGRPAPRGGPAGGEVPLQRNPL